MTTKGNIKTGKGVAMGFDLIFLPHCIYNSSTNISKSQTKRYLDENN